MHVIYQSADPDYGYEHDLLRTYGPLTTVENKPWVPLYDFDRWYFPLHYKGSILNIRTKTLPVLLEEEIRSDNWAYGGTKFHKLGKGTIQQYPDHPTLPRLKKYPPVLVYTDYFLNDDILSSKVNCFAQQDYPAPMPFFFLNKCHPTHKLNNFNTRGRRSYIMSTNERDKTPLNQRGFNYVIKWVDGYYPRDYVSRLVSRLTTPGIEEVRPTGFMTINGEPCELPSLVDYHYHMTGEKPKKVVELSVPDLFLRGDVNTTPNRYYTGYTESRDIPREDWEKINRDGHTGFGFASEAAIQWEATARPGGKPRNDRGAGILVGG